MSSLPGVIAGDEDSLGKASKVDPATQRLSDDLTNMMLRDFITRLEEQKVRLLLNIKDYKHTLDQAKEDDRYLLLFE